MPSRRFFVSLSLSVATVLALALALRHLAVEPRDAGLLCAGADPAWWCGPRDAVIAVFRWNLFGGVSLLAGLVGFVTGRRAAGVVALLAGAAGLVLYNVGPASAGVVLGLVAVTRAAPPPWPLPRRSGSATGC